MAVPDGIDFAPVATPPEVAVTAKPPVRPRQTFYQKHEATILGWGAVLLFLGIWQALWSAGQISPLFMSGPSAIAKRFWEDLLHGSLLADFNYSAKNFAIGFVAASLAGVVMGVLI